MEQRPFRDYSRLLILTFFLFSNGFLFIRWISWLIFIDEKAVQPPFSVAIIVLLCFCFLFWYAVELFECFQLHYKPPSELQGYLLFALRILPFILAFSLDRRSITLLFPIFFLVISFYTSITFRLKPSVVLIILIMAGQLTSELMLTEPLSPISAGTEKDLFFIVYKLSNSLLGWLMGYFWMRDVKRWQRNQRLNRDLRDTQKQLRRYAKQVAETVVLEERNRLARDIHDSLGHNLTAASIQLLKAESYFNREPEVSKTALSEAKNCIQDGMQDIREVLNDLSSLGNTIDFFSQIRNAAAKLPTDRFETRLQLEGLPNQCNRAVLLAILRMIQEGITNSIKHSRANCVQISVVIDDEHVTARLSDNGIGISPETLGQLADPNTPSGEKEGLGLRGLKDRIALVLGSLEISTSAEGGTLLEAVVPKEPAAHIGEYNEHEGR